MDTLATRMVLETPNNMSGTIVSEIVDLNNMIHLGIHAIWTGAPAGDLYMEVSGEIGEPTNWETFDSAAVAGSGTQFWIDRNIPYRWARVRYVPTAGTGTMKCHGIAKGEL